MMRTLIPILLISIVAAGCNYRKDTDIEPNVEVPTSYAEGTGDEVPPPPKQPDRSTRSGQRSMRPN